MRTPEVHGVSAERLRDWTVDARARTAELVEDLTDAQLVTPRLPIVNPFLWELGHVGWFSEQWVLRARGRPAMRTDGDRLYDSSRVAHDTRWELPLPDRVATLSYLSMVRDRVLDALAEEPSPSEAYLALLAIFHEDMHGEALTSMRQTLGLPAPRRHGSPGPEHARGQLPGGDVRFEAATFRQGSDEGAGFVFDNEKPSQETHVDAFALARCPVTETEFATFVHDRGYERAELWTFDGWQWRSAVGALHPVAWRPSGGSYEVRRFDRWSSLDARLPVVHVCWWEADAYCRWAKRRLPTESEWELAATGGRAFPWGDPPPAAEHASLDARAIGCAPVEAFPAGDAPGGCRQLIGNVWEWCADAFEPYPGFAPDPYRDYSQPWFGTHRVLRGGCWATRARLIRPAYRNFFLPDRRDVFAGFRTAARRGGR